MTFFIEEPLRLRKSFKSCWMAGGNGRAIWRRLAAPARFHLNIPSCCLEVSRCHSIASSMDLDPLVPVVIDCGSSQCRYGNAGEDAPKTFPTVVGRPKAVAAAGAGG